MARRGALKLFAGAGAGLVLAACQAPIGSGGGTATTTASGPGGSASTGAGAGGSTAACTPIPDETSGPYPGDGTSGRWPHAHFEVYETLGAATSGRNAIATSQLALPEDVCRTVYASDGYARSVTNLNQTSLARDMVFSDGWTDQLATTISDVASGYTASLTVPL